MAGQSQHPCAPLCARDAPMRERSNRRSGPTTSWEENDRGRPQRIMKALLSPFNERSWSGRGAIMFATTMILLAQSQGGIIQESRSHLPCTHSRIFASPHASNFGCRRPVIRLRGGAMAYSAEAARQMEFMSQCDDDADVCWEMTKGGVKMPPVAKQREKVQMKESKEAKHAVEQASKGFEDLQADISFVSASADTSADHLHDEPTPIMPKRNKGSSQSMLRSKRMRQMSESEMPFMWPRAEGEISASERLWGVDGSAESLQCMLCRKHIGGGCEWFMAYDRRHCSVACAQISAGLYDKEHPPASDRDPTAVYLCTQTQ